MAQVDMRELRKQQNADSCVGFWLRAVKDKKKSDKAHIHTREDAAMLKSFESFKIIKGLLYREVVSESETKNQYYLFVILSKSYRVFTMTWVTQVKIERCHYCVIHSFGQE